MLLKFFGVLFLFGLSMTAMNCSSAEPEISPLVDPRTLPFDKLQPAVIEIAQAQIARGEKTKACAKNAKTSNDLAQCLGFLHKPDRGPRFMSRRLPQ